jgi:hypothetical protein
MQTRIRKDRKRSLRTVDQDVLPPQLQRSPPRDVVLNASGWVTAICAVALLLGGILGGLLLAQKLAADSAEAAEFRASGIPADAIVTRVRRGSSGEDSQTRVSYRYAAAGRQFENRVELRNRNPLSRTIETGSRFRVVYLPSRPDKSWLEGRGPRESPVWVAAILPALGIPSALLLAVVLLRQRRLLEDGRAVMARVTSVEKKSQSEDSWRIAYTWRLLNGATRTAHVDRSTEPSGAGSYFPVVYDRDRPERYSTWPFSLVKLR